MVIRLIWRQWAVINEQIGPNSRRSRHIVDPEMLVLMSQIFAPLDQNLRDVTAWFACKVSALLSVQRMRTLWNRLQSTIEFQFDFPAWAVELGGDRRWEPLVSKLTRPPDFSRFDVAPRFEDEATLMLRLRAGFGVGVKPDVVSYLCCLNGLSRPAVDIAETLGYTDKSVRLSLKELCTAAFAVEGNEYPKEYWIGEAFDHRFLTQLFGHPVDSPPIWWYPVQLLDALISLRNSSSSEHAHRAGALSFALSRQLREAGIRLPRRQLCTPADYEVVANDFITQVANFMEITE